jgi:hypothetical protein
MKNRESEVGTGLGLHAPGLGLYSVRRAKVVGIVDRGRGHCVAVRIWNPSL